MGRFLHCFSPGFPLQEALLTEQVAGAPNPSPRPQRRTASSQVSAGGWQWGEGGVPGPRRGWAWLGCSETPMPILHLRVRLAVSQLRKSLNSGSETHVTPNMAAPPSACPRHGGLWQSQTAWPWAHSCPLVFLLAPTPAIQWGLKPQKAGASLLAAVPIQVRVLPHHPYAQAASAVQARKSLPSLPSFSLAAF